MYTTRPITAAAVIIGWFGVYFIYHQHWLGFVFCIITTILSVLALRRGKRLAQEQKRRLQVALDRAADRNRELEGLRHLAATLLAGGELNHLLEEVAKAASELLKAEGGMVTLVVEEGRFLRVTAASGMLKGFTGALMPVTAVVMCTRASRLVCVTFGSRTMVGISSTTRSELARGCV